MYELVYKWGLYHDNSGDPRSWYMRVEALDTDWYAMAHYQLDDSDPAKFYEFNNEELLYKLVGPENTSLYEQCVQEKNRILQKYKEIESIVEDVTIEQFM